MARVAAQTAQQQVQLTAALQNLAAAQAATTAPTATAEVEPRLDTGGKILTPPEAFSPATLEEEVSQWSDWAFTFKNFLAFMDQDFLTDLEEAENEEAAIAMGGPFLEEKMQKNKRIEALPSVEQLSKERTTQSAEERGKHEWF